MSHSPGVTEVTLQQMSFSANSRRASVFQKPSEHGATMVLKGRDSGASLSHKDGFHLWDLQLFSEDHTAAVLSHPCYTSQVFEVVKARVWSPGHSQGCHLLCFQRLTVQAFGFCGLIMHFHSPWGCVQCEAAVCAVIGRLQPRSLWWRSIPHWQSAGWLALVECNYVCLQECCTSTQIPGACTLHEYIHFPAILNFSS